MDGAARWAAFYRNNPDRFAEEYLHLKLKLFQRVLLVMMFCNTVFVFIASRGAGKSFLSAIYCVIRCILWPGTKICIASGRRSQSINVLEKIIYELEPVSDELRAEINQKETKITSNNAQIVFNNNSVIKVVTASDSARGKEEVIYISNNGRVVKWTKEDLDFLIQEYPKMSTDDLAKILNRSHNSIIIKANRLGIQKPHNTQDNEYFDIIDSCEKAYWLGFITADGYVVNNMNGRNWELGIELSISDLDHLEKFKKSINSSREITIRKRTHNFKDTRYSDREYETCQVRIFSKHLVESLEQYGIVQNKTNCINFPETIPKQFVWDYIRGFYDGDGSFFEQSIITPYDKLHVYPRVSFTCKRLEFLKGLGQILNDNNIYYTISKDDKCYVMFIRRQDSVTNFFDLIYQNSNCIKLDRKYNHYCSFFNLNRLPA